MSASHGRLSQSRDRAQPISEGKTVEVLASDLDELLTHYRSLIIEIGDVRETLAVAVSAERAACANLCEEVSDEYKLREGRKYPEARHDAQEGADMCANKIRARQEPQG